MIDFDELYQRHAGSVYRFALSLSGDRSLAEDITSETFIRMWTARERIDLATVEGYLITIARHLYLRGTRERGHERAEVPEGSADARPGPRERAEDRAELDAVVADLQTLPEPDRAALLMRAWEEMSYEEIAAALKITVAAAKVKVHRARLRLAERRLSRGALR